MAASPAPRAGLNRSGAIVNQFSFDPHAERLTKIHIGARLNPNLGSLFGMLGVLGIILGLALTLLGLHAGLSLCGVGVILAVLGTWLSRDLLYLPPAPLGSTTRLDQLLPSHVAVGYRADLNAEQLWAILAATPDAGFLVSRFGLDPAAVAAALAGQPLDHSALFGETAQLATELKQPLLTPALIICALVNLSPALQNQLTTAKLTTADLIEGALWVARLRERNRYHRPFYGGIARDWASGFTPLLARFGTNLSQQVEYSRYQLPERTVGLDTLATGLESGTGSVVLVGEPGIGKTALLTALADHLLAGEHGSLAHHQIIALNASVILANAQAQGEIESIVLGLFNEAVRAGNIVIALDEAQLFFGSGTGAVNLSQILLPILQAHSLKLVLAVTPGDWQRLRATNPAMSSLLTPLVLTEADEVTTLRLTADHGLELEGGRLITTWRAVQEAYRLSGRYFQDEAYPGRALKLLEAGFNYPDSQFVSERSIEQAIESQFGVKTQTATASESDALLHLEERIHQRMINQTRAVSVVSAALRRARAGVSNPKRPIGSFLFLGPTGVGKTELARSLAATYFGAETSMIRLDMSEYQQVPDVDRILAPAEVDSAGLLSQVRGTPFSVVLFDEIEKAHPNILNLFLQLLDEGSLTDTDGHPASFKDTIIIATSNAGADVIRERIEAGQKLEDFEEEFTNGLIDSGIFKPELLNRFDEIVLFRPLNQAELGQVVQLMVAEVNRTLEPQKISVRITDTAAAELVAVGYDPRLGARPMRRMVQRRVEDTVADMILRGAAHPGDVITLDGSNLVPPPEPAAPLAAPPPPPPNDPRG